jgi:hypothetical protein
MNIVRRADAPPPGWYPDPETRGQRLRWWDGTDWSHHDRDLPLAEGSFSAHPLPPGSDPAAWMAQGQQFVDQRFAGRPMGRSDVDQVIAEVRTVARAEIDRAADVFSQRARAATREIQPLVTQYTSTLLRWVRTIVIVAVILLVAWFLFQVIAQASFFEWLGDRIDNLTEDTRGP